MGGKAGGLVGQLGHGNSNGYPRPHDEILPKRRIAGRRGWPPQVDFARLLPTYEAMLKSVQLQ
jgi:hypothetical protein